jgi:hypothetical protein
LYKIFSAFLSRIHEERELIKQQEAAEKLRLEEEIRLVKKREEEEKMKVEEEERKKKEDEKRRIREERLAKRNQIKAKKRIENSQDSMDILEASLLNDESKDSAYVSLVLSLMYHIACILCVLYYIIFPFIISYHN